jgi:hypothetical protein
MVVKISSKNKIFLRAERWHLRATVQFDSNQSIAFLFWTYGQRRLADNLCYFTQHGFTISSNSLFDKSIVKGGSLKWSQSIRLKYSVASKWNLTILNFQIFLFADLKRRESIKRLTASWHISLFSFPIIVNKTPKSFYIFLILNQIF